MSKLSAKDRRRIALGAIQIAIIDSFGLYYLCALSYNIFLLYVVPITIGILCGLAIIGKSIKEAVLKWAFSIPLWWVAVLLVANTEVNRRLTLKLTGYDDLTVGDGFGYMLAVMFVVFWTLVFTGAGVWFSGYGKKSEKQLKVLYVIQAVPINIVCAVMIVGLVLLNILLPPYKAGVHYT